MNRALLFTLLVVGFFFAGYLGALAAENEAIDGPLYFYFSVTSGVSMLATLVCGALLITILIDQPDTKKRDRP